MKKKRWYLAAVVLAFAVMLAGCGSALGADGSDDGGTSTQGQETSYEELSEGDEAPDFTASLADGGTFTLSEHEGEVVLLNFWATWCGPCVEEMPAFAKLEKEYGDKIRILAVNASEDQATVDAFIEDAGYTFPIAYDESGEISAKYPTDGIPYTLVIGKDGRIASIFLGANGADEQYKAYRSALKEAYEG